MESARTPIKIGLWVEAAPAMSEDQDVIERLKDETRKEVHPLYRFLLAV